MNKVKNLVLGAGLSGISFCIFDDNKEYVVLEATDSYGGYCKTFKIKDYIWDYAGHFYHFQNKELKNMFLKLVDKSQLIESEKNTKIYYKGNFINYPFQMNIHELEKEEFIDCLYDLYFKKEKEEYDDFLDMLYGKFGKSITDKFLKPYNEKLYATELKKLDKDAMGRFFPYADFEGIIKNMKANHVNTYNSKFWYLKGGTQYYVDKLYSKLDKEKFLYNKEVIKVDMNNQFVETSDGEKYYYQNLINTIPLNKFLSLFGGYEKTVSKMSYNKVLVFNVGFEKNTKKYKGIHWVYFPDKALNFYRVGFYNNILNKNKLSIYVEVGFSSEEKIDVESEYKKMIEGLEKVGIKEKDNNVVAFNHIIMNPAYVHINGKVQKEIDLIFKELKKHNIYSIGRYGKWTYNSMEDSMLWAKELAEEIGD